jgi:Ca2+-binding RTX toxin-like protein
MLRTDAPLQCIWDAGGTDTFDFSACTGATIINLNAGSFSSTAPGYNNISIAYNVTIERAIAGSGGSTIYANNAGNVITGGAGNDVIYEGAGSDQITGNGGSDTVVFTKALTSYAFSGATGT